MATERTISQSDDSESEAESCEYTREELFCTNPFNEKICSNFSKRRNRYMALFDVENWASALEDFTFATEVAQLEVAEAVAIQHFYQEGICQHRNKITRDDEQALESLRCKIGSLISQLQSRSNESPGVFVRLGPRSPKDAPMMVSNPPPDMPSDRASRFGFSEQKIQAALEPAAWKFLQTKGQGYSHGDGKAEPCEVLRCFQDVSYSLLRVTSADEALALLLNSSRVMQDICHTLDTLDESSTGWSMTIVARDWDNQVRLEREFRTFVVAGELTAVSQYDDQLMYPFVTQQQEKIVAAIRECLTLAKPKLQLLFSSTAVVVDFLVVPHGDDHSPWKARIIELNPFGPMTGASLFTWTADRRRLQGGKDLYGDLHDCENTTPPGSVVLPPHVEERTILHVPFRYLVSNPAAFTWEHLKAYWPDYVRLAPELLAQNDA